MNRLAGGILLLTLLAACGLQTLGPNPDSALRFDICDKALEQPTKARAFQGFDGWFFFDLDFEESYPLLEQADFIIELSEQLRAQGVTLVALPVPSRAVIRPDVLYLHDPLQAGFDPRQAEASYSAFAEALHGSGVVTVDVVASARAFGAAGGQTFFRRDLHWTPEGANTVFSETAAQIQQALDDTLPHTQYTITRRSQDAGHRGQFVNSWTSENCGYLLPPEPLGVYDVSRAGPKAEGQAEVVLAGSSFSIEPYAYDFLAAALGTEVANVAVGSGGATVALQRYLLGGTYRTHKPKVLVWEFPIYAPAIGEETRRDLLAAAAGTTPKKTKVGRTAPHRDVFGSAFFP